MFCAFSVQKDLCKNKNRASEDLYEARVGADSGRDLFGHVGAHFMSYCRIVDR